MSNLVRNVIIDLDFRSAYRNFVFTRDNDSKHTIEKLLRKLFIPLTEQIGEIQEFTNLKIFPGIITINENKN